MEAVIGGLVILLVIAGYKLYKNNIQQTQMLNLQVDNRNFQEDLRDLQGVLVQLQDELGQEREKNREVLSQKKSSETRLGNISEHLVGFLNGCPYDPRDMHHLGAPIDFLIYDLDQGEITFLEVKSGN